MAEIEVTITHIKTCHSPGERPVTITTRVLKKGERLRLHDYTGHRAVNLIGTPDGIFGTIRQRHLPDDPTRTIATDDLPITSAQIYTRRAENLPPKYKLITIIFQTTPPSHQRPEN